MPMLLPVMMIVPLFVMTPIVPPWLMMPAVVAPLRGPVLMILPIASPLVMAPGAGTYCAADTVGDGVDAAAADDTTIAVGDGHRCCHRC
jgi:hypothetical protein